MSDVCEANLSRSTCLAGDGQGSDAINKSFLPYRNARKHLLAPLIDLGKEAFEDFFLQTLALVHPCNHLLDLANSALFVVVIKCLKIQFVEDFFHLGLCSIIFSSIVFI